MNIIFTILLILQFRSLELAGKCTEGTLVCDTSAGSPKSVFCDFFNWYKLTSEGTCVQKHVDGCLVNGLDQLETSCLVCDSGKVHDSKESKCVEVRENMKIENCLIYDRDVLNCEKCEQDYFLAHGKCLALGKNTIQNCDIYFSLNQCSVCQIGYYLKDNMCKRIEAVENCQFHTDRQCNACAQGYC